MELESLVAGGLGRSQVSSGVTGGAQVVADDHRGSMVASGVARGIEGPHVVRDVGGDLKGLGMVFRGRESHIALGVIDGLKGAWGSRWPCRTLFLRRQSPLLVKSIKMHEIIYKQPILNSQVNGFLFPVNG
jgi:hypothetical protein